MWVSECVSLCVCDCILIVFLNSKHFPFLNYSSPEERELTNCISCVLVVSSLCSQRSKKKNGNLRIFGWSSYQCHFLNTFYFDSRRSFQSINSYMSAAEIQYNYQTSYSCNPELHVFYPPTMSNIENNYEMIWMLIGSVSASALADDRYELRMRFGSINRTSTERQKPLPPSSSLLRSGRLQIRHLGVSIPFFFSQSHTFQI